MENKTSAEAARILGLTFASPIKAGVHASVPREVLEKYKRMEDALRQIADGFTDCKSYEMKPCEAEAKEALLFDPLS